MGGQAFGGSRPLILPCLPHPPLQPFYMAPELAATGKATKASDVYSFGVLMWEVYRCMPPWLPPGPDGTYAPNPRFHKYPPATPHV